jgi:TRAP-type C4-dicarboxylate transport system permease small subunit
MDPPRRQPTTPTVSLDPPRRRGARRLLAAAHDIVDRLNALLITASAIAAGLAGCVLTWEVAGRYFFKIPSDWQDELSVFLLVGATFCSASWIQARRGHVGIDALHEILPEAADRARRFLADLAALAFCLFFAWKCWTLLLEAWEEGQTTSSPWGPPLWIPYGMMSFGMSVLVAQLVLQVIDRRGAEPRR